MLYIKRMIRTTNGVIHLNDYIIRAVTKDGLIRAFSATTTNMVKEAQRIHDTSPIATAALGRTLTAAAMMSLMLKGEKDSLTIQIKGDGPLGGIVVAADSKANVRGYVYHPHVDLPRKANGKLDVGGAVGRNGFLSIVRDLGLKEPYVGQVPLVSGEIAEDLTLYYARSEQIPSAVALGVLADRDLIVKAAGGFIVQLMPGADDRTVEKIESIIASLPSVSEMVTNGLNAEGILEKVLEGFEVDILEKTEAYYRCECSRDRIERALISVGERELQDMIEEQGEAELTCHFCNQKYHFNKQELQRLLEHSK